MNLNIDKCDWMKVKLNDVCEWYQKNIPNDAQLDFGIEYYVTANHIDSDSIKFERYSELSDGQKGPTITKHFEKGDLLLSTRSVALRKAAIAPVDGVTGEKLLVLRVKPESALLRELMPFVFQSIDFWEYTQNSASGSVNKFTSWTKIREYEFLLPPKDQQAQMAKLLWAMDEDIEGEINTLHKEIDFKISYRKALLKGEESGKFNQLGFLGSYYPIKKLNDYAVVKGRIGWKGLKKSEYVDDGPYLIASKHIKDGQVNWDKCDMITDFRYDESPEIALKQGDVVFSKDGAIGNPAHIDKLPGNATINSTMMLLRPNENLDSEYLYQLLLSAYFERLKIRCLSGSAIPHIFQGDMKNFEFPMPDLLKQKQIGSELKQLDILRRSIEDKIQASKSLQKSIINQIF